MGVKDYFNGKHLLRFMDCFPKTVTTLWPGGTGNMDATAQQNVISDQITN